MLPDILTGNSIQLRVVQLLTMESLGVLRKVGWEDSWSIFDVSSELKDHPDFAMLAKHQMELWNQPFYMHGRSQPGFGRLLHDFLYFYDEEKSIFKIRINEGERNSLYIKLKWHLYQQFCPKRWEVLVDFPPDLATCLALTTMERLSFRREQVRLHLLKSVDSKNMDEVITAIYLLGKMARRTTGGRRKRLLRDLMTIRERSTDERVKISCTIVENGARLTNCHNTNSQLLAI
jgi:hypothetical protein